MTGHPEAIAALESSIGLDPTERDRWQEVADGLVAARYRDGVIEQFTGYFERDDVPITEWDANNMPRYPKGYHHFNCENTQLLKQPDGVMLMYLLPDEFSAEVKKASFEYYEARTLHKSSLSPSIHAIIGIEVGDTTRAVQYFERSAFVDLTDNQGNTAEGMHIASAGGTWQILVNGFGGLRILGGRVTLTPWLPDDWEGIRFRLRWRGRPIRVAVDHDTHRAAAGRTRGRDRGGRGERQTGATDLRHTRRGRLVLRTRAARRPGVRPGSSDRRSWLGGDRLAGRRGRGHRGGSSARAGQPQSGTSDGEATQGRGPDRRAQDRPRRERGDGRDDEEQAAGASGSALADQGEEQQRAGDAGDDGDPEEGADRPGRVRDDQGAFEWRPGRHHQGRGRDLGRGERGRTSRCAQSALKDGACGESCQAEQRPAERRDRRRSAEAVDQGDGDAGDAQRDAGPLPGREPVPAQGAPAAATSNGEEQAIRAVVDAGVPSAIPV